MGCAGRGLIGRPAIGVHDHGLGRGPRGVPRKAARQSSTRRGAVLGGLLAQELYRLNPDRVVSLILADTYAGWRGSLSAGVAEERLEAALRDARLKPDQFVKLYLPAMFGPTVPEGVREELRRVMANFHPAGFRAMATALGVADTRATLAKIAVPTLLMWGEQDARSPVAVAREMQALITGSRLAVIPRVGHISNMEDATTFNAEVRAFLAPALHAAVDVPER